MKRYSVTFILSPLIATTLWAAPVTVTITDATLNSLGAGQYLTDKINSEFQVPKLTDFLKQMSNAQAIANKGQGVSYATEHSLFVVGANLGLGLGKGDVDGWSFSTSSGLPPIGLGAQASIMVGLSLAKFPMPTLGPIDLKRLTIFANFFTISNDSLVDSLTIKTNTFGLHAQYKVIQGKNLSGIGILNWGGLAFTTGFDVSSNALKYKIGQTISTDVSGSKVTWTPSSSSSLDLDASTVTIPFEVSTSVRLLYILSLFAGVGLDLNMGKTTISANMDGIISSTGSVNSTNAGSASFVTSDNQGPSVGQLRFFAGPQFNLVPLKNTNLLSLYVQGNASTGGSYGAHGGLRIAW